MISALVSAVVCSLGWGLSPIFAKKSMESMSYLLSTGFFGMFFGLLGLVVLAVAYYQNPNTFITDVKNYPRGLNNTFWAAFSSYILGSLFFFFALNKAKNTSMIILIAYVLPIIVSIILARIIFKDKINCMMLVGMFITVIGLIVTVKYKEN